MDFKRRIEIQDNINKTIKESIINILRVILYPFYLINKFICIGDLRCHFLS